MAKDVLAQFALDQAQSVVAPDGHLTLDRVEDGVAYIRYRIVDAVECSKCVVTPDDLKIFLQEIFSSRAPHISSFDIHVENASTP
jgi:hypothetical protein